MGYSIKKFTAYYFTGNFIQYLQFDKSAVEHNEVQILGSIKS